MIKYIILKIAPKSINPEMLWITEIFLSALILLFLISFFWITVRIVFRWVGIVRCKMEIKGNIKKTEGIKGLRNSVKELIPKYMRWAVDGFQTFSLAWEEARLPEDEKAVLPIRLREFLPPETVLDGIRNQRISEALPGIFVGLGIFGTFLGLCLGLRELEFGKIENLQNGVGHLISGLSLAFLTSLVGIALSIIFSFTYRLAINRLERTFLSLDVLFCQIYPFESQERFARRHFQMQGEVKQGLQTLATDVAMQISGAIGPKLGEALESHLVPVLKDLHGWIQTHIEENQNQQNKIVEGFNDHLTRLSKVITTHFNDSQDRQAEAMEAVLQHYSYQLTETFQKQFDEMGKVIIQTTQAQLEIKQQLVDFSEQLQKQFQSQNELIEKTTNAGEVLSQSMESLESIAVKLKDSAIDITTAAELLEQSAISAKQGQEILRETMERQIDTMSTTRKELEDTWRVVTDKANSLVDQVSQTIHEFTTGVGDDLVKALETFDSKVAEVVERFSGTLFEASNTIADMPQLIIGLNENIGAISTGVNEQKDVLREIRDTSKSMITENVQMACDASKELKDSADRIGDTVVTIGENFNNFSNQLVENGKSFNQQSQQILGDMKRMIDELIIELRQNQSFLGQKDEINKMLWHDGNRPPSINEAELLKIDESIGKPIATLCSQLDNLIGTISKTGNNGDKELRKDIIAKVQNIDKGIQDAAPGLKNILMRLENMDTGISRLQNTFENLKLEQSKLENASVKKWGIFGLGNKN